MKNMKPVLFTLEGQNYGIDINMVNAIEEYRNIALIPNAPSYIKGIINLRGQIIPVYSLRVRFNFAPTKEQGALLIIKIRGTDVALEVDKVEEIHDFESEDVFEVPRIVITPETDYMECIVKHEDRIIILLDADKLVSADECDAIKDFVDKQ